MNEGLQESPKKLFCGAGVCHYDNEDEGRNKAAIIALFDPDGVAIPASKKKSEDRLYTGEMFVDKKKNLAVNFSIADRKPIGQKKAKTETTDHVIISNWRVGGMNLHYARLNDVTIPHPPLEGDDRFYFSHSRTAVYWLTKIDALKTGIVVLQLANFEWYLHELQDGVAVPRNLQNSSLICNDHVLVYQNAAAKKGKRLSADFLFYDLFAQQVVYQAEEVEKIFFSGKEIDKDDEGQIRTPSI